MKFYTAQAIGLIGMIIAFISFQHNEKKKILWTQAFGAVMFTLHFFLLGAFTGMIMNLLSIPRNLVFAVEHKKEKQLFFTILFILLFIISGIFTWESPRSAFPISAMSLGTIVFSLKSPSVIRFCSLPISIFWLIYNIISISYAGILTESFCFASIIIAIFRFNILKKPELEKIEK